MFRSRLAGCLFLLLLLAAVPQAKAQHDYKVSRNLIRKGNYEQALAVLEKKRQAQPTDSEWVYQSAIALAQTGKLEPAMADLEKAIALGVTRQRCAADAHHWLKPLTAVPAFQKLLRDQANQPIGGPMLGAVTDKQARVWVRTANEAMVQVELIGPDGKRISDVVRTKAQDDYAAVVSLEDLKPSVLYRYRVLVDGQANASAELKTAPRKGQGARFSFAFGGGAGYVPQHERMWDTIAAQRPDALFLLGDNIYSDDPTSTAMQRFCYYRRQSPEPFRRLVAHTPVYSIWDDHDFGTNDCSGGPLVDKPVWKREVWDVFRRNWVNPAYGGGRELPGCWYDFTIADVHFIMLDGRCYRHLPSGTMLGPKQKAWLKETLEKSTGKFKVIASPVPWEFRTKGKSKDTWNGFREERKEIFDFLTENRIEGVLLISADRHRSDAWKIERENGYSLYEFNSSRLTNNHVHGEMKQAIFSYNKKQSFGLVEFDTTLSDPTIRYTVVNIDGEKIHTLLLRRSQLK